MSRTFRSLTLAFAFCTVSTLALAQAGGGGGVGSSDGASPPPGGGGASATMGGATGTTMGPRGAASTNPAFSTARSGRSMRAGRPARRAAMRRPMRQNAAMTRRGGRAASGSDAAYMGGGAVYERGSDGSMRPAN